MIKIVKVDEQIIRNFRDLVNSNSYFAYYKYSNVEGKNHWSCICSCMDWIQLAVDHINNLKLNTININVFSMEVYSYISSIDIINESICQLHRVIVGNSTPFSKEKQIFKSKDYPVSDNDYFKHIRAIFGAHPVNIKGKGNSKWFASWPSDKIRRESFDFTVFLYSSEISEDSILFGFKFDELNDFLFSRYNYLKVLSVNLMNNYDTFCNKMRNIEIPKSDNTITQIEILIEESKKRLDSDSDNYYLENLLTLFKAGSTLSSNNDLIRNYRLNLEKVVDEIKQNLQKMSFENLISENILSPNYPDEIEYSLRTLLPILMGSDYRFDFNYHVERIAEFLKEIITIQQGMEFGELLLLINTGLYFYWQNNVK